MVIDEKEGKEGISCLPDYQYLTANYFHSLANHLLYTDTEL